MSFLFTKMFFVVGFALSILGCDLRQRDQAQDEAKEPASEVKSGANEVGNVGADTDERFATSKFRSNGDDIYTYTNDGYLDVKCGGTTDIREGDIWAFHHPLEGVEDGGGASLGFLQQFAVADGNAYLWVKTPSAGAGARVVCYYTTDGSSPIGSEGVPAGTSQVADFAWSHNTPGVDGKNDDWWRLGPLSMSSERNSFSYKIGVFRAPSVN